MHEVSPGGIGMPCPVRYGAEMRMEDGSGLSTHALTTNAAHHRDNLLTILLYLAIRSVTCQNDTLGNLGRARHATDASREYAADGSVGP